MILLSFLNSANVIFLLFNLSDSYHSVSHIRVIASHVLPLVSHHKAQGKKKRSLVQEGSSSSEGGFS